jgi:hypothetical protein
VVIPSSRFTTQLNDTSQLCTVYSLSSVPSIVPVMRVMYLVSIKMHILPLNRVSDYYYYYYCLLKQMFKRNSN